MGRRSRSRSRSSGRDRKKHRDHREKSRERHREKSKERSRSKERTHKPKSQRISKWSDAPPDASMHIYDPNRAKEEAKNLLNAITINPEARNALNEQVNKQAEIFGVLDNAKIDSSVVDTRMETIRPNQGWDMNLSADSKRIKRKIYIPQDGKFNYTGLIIGPHGANQKRLEEATGCKILIRGRGTQKPGQAPQPDDNEDQHVLIMGESDFQIAKATAEIERILFADEETRAKIKSKQLEIIAQKKSEVNPDAFVVMVPNDYVGLVIGKGGEKIKQLQTQSGAKKVQVATESEKGADYRKLYVDGDREAYEIVQELVREIIEQQQRLNQALKVEVPVPDNLVGLIIGRGGETIRAIKERTGASVFVPKERDPGKSERYLTVSGTPDQVENARREINEKVQEGIANLQMKALQASGIPLHLLSNPDFFQQMMSAYNPAYAMMYQQTYAQQPVVTDVVDPNSLPGGSYVQQGMNPQQQYQQQGMNPQQQFQQQGMNPQQQYQQAYMPNYSYPADGQNYPPGGM